MAYLMETGDKRKYMFYSYDIFDTVLYRKALAPADIFAFMTEDESFGRLWAGSRDSFPDICRNAEQRLWKKNRNEVTIESIYREVSTRSGIDRQTAQALMELEFQMECGYSFLSGAVCREIADLRRAGQRVVLISETIPAAANSARWF